MAKQSAHAFITVCVSVRKIVDGAVTKTKCECVLYAYTFDRFSWLVVVVERNAEQAVRTKVKNECGMQRMT